MELPEEIEVDLGAYVSDLDPVQMKTRVPAPIRYRAEALTELLVREVRALGSVSRDEVVAALVQAAELDPQALRQKVERYREARVWETLGERRRTGQRSLPTPRTGRPAKRHRAS